MTVTVASWDSLTPSFVCLQVIAASSVGEEAKATGTLSTVIHFYEGRRLHNRRSARRRATVATTKLTFGGCACFETLARSVYRWMRASMAVPEACRRAMYRRWSIASGRRSTNTVIPCDRRQLRSEATTSACPALSSAPEGRRRNVGVVLDSRPGIWTTIAGMTWPRRAAGSPACSWPDVREHLNVPSWGRGGRK